ncbi:hypothetical protein BDV38DRAFT_291944 [Aspergillus pseudotamarii]|uniref:NACHT domain-containing protein n=1 Tax=Aspergillus pseudotamarii TaxID=132259 RepID=A0A5N6TAM1_ASPPS|nr:uncharacterized protein BDV38DRAFT_291944 [Aspergillus pseudotamarii]KAE8143191.1 hypothetical protein BDV38DRAFT_291944 [Aspergillus pseudotamarii]
MFQKLVDCLDCGKDHSDSGDDNGAPSRPVNLNRELRKEEEGGKAGLPTRLSQRQVESEPKSQDLWVLAKERLSPEDQKCFEGGNAKTTEKTIEEVRDAIEEKYKEYKDGGLQIRGPHGKNINLQECFQGIIKSVSQVQELIKNATSFDPTGHASGFLANNLSYYAIIDRNDRNRQVESDEHLEEALVKVYAAILEYTAEVYRASREKGTARVWKSVSALVDQPLQRLKQAIELEEENVRKWTDLGRNLGSQEMEILNWLSPTDQSGGEQSAIYNKAQKDRTSQTGDWFLDSPECQKWMAEPGSILRLHGVVGCGKTVLCSTIIAHVHKVCECDPKKRLAYWFFNFNQNSQQVVEIMLRSVIRQLCPNPVPESIIKLWEGHRQGREPTQENLFVILEQMIESHKGHIILIFDALDECPELPGNSARGTLLKFLNRLIDQHKETLHILVTSRPEHDIRFHLGKYPGYDIEEDLSQDVERFVDDRLEQGEPWKWLSENRPMKEKIRKRLLGMERPRFRWAYLQIMQLERCHTPAAIDNALERLPKDLSETYSSILNKMPEDDREAARTILIWVIFSRHSLTLEFLAKLVDFIRPRDVVNVCTTSLITVSSDNVVRLAHFSVKEFLIPVDISGETLWYQFSASTGHLTIANTSLSLLSRTDNHLTRDAALAQPVLVYAARNLGFHLLELDAIGFQSPELQESIVHIFCSPVTYFNWVRIDHDYKNFNDWYLPADQLEPPIYRASKMGLIQIVESLLKKGADPLAPFNNIFRGKENAFYAAATMGHLDVLERLVQISSVISKDLACSIIRCIDHRDQEWERVRKILALLHDKTSFYHDQEHGNTIDKSIIAAAAGNWRWGDTLIQILLDWPNRAVIHITEDVMCTAVRNITCGERIMQRLLKEQAKHVHIDPQGLKHMIKHVYRNPGVVRVVVEMRGREIQFDDWTMRDFMKYASAEAVNLLLSCRDDIVVTSKMLEAATDNRNSSGALLVLLKKRASSTPVSTEMLAIAAGNRECGFEVMKVLLGEWSPGTPINEEVIYKLASNRSQGLEIMDLFLRRQQTGITVSQKVLAQAARLNTSKMLELLVNNAGSGIKITPEILCEAAQNSGSPEAVMSYLLDLGGKDLEISEDVLVSAAGNFFKGADVLSLVLDKFPEVKVTDRVFEAACQSQDSMSVLLKRFPNQFPKEIVVEGIAKQTVFGRYALGFLIGHAIVDIDQELVEKLAHNFPVSHQTLLVAAATDSMCMDAVLCACKMDIIITADIVDAALESGGFDVIHLLFSRYGSRFPITEMVLTRAALHKNPHHALDFLLERESGVDLQRVWENTVEDFLKYKPEIKTTQEQFDALAGHESFPGSLTETLLDRNDFC